MDVNSIVSFVRIIRSYPELSSDKRKFKKRVDRLIEDTFNIRKKKLRDNLDEQKREIFECFDKYNEILADGLNEAIVNPETGKDLLIEKLVGAFFPQEKEKNNVEKTAQTGSEDHHEG